jgi:hypothetical protein
MATVQGAEIIELIVDGGESAKNRQRPPPRGLEYPQTLLSRRAWYGGIWRTYHRTLETCFAEVEQSDVYVGIVAYRLGSLDPATKKPFTVLEYERAVEQTKETTRYERFFRPKRWTCTLNCSLRSKM